MSEIQKKANKIPESIRQFIQVQAVIEFIRSTRKAGIAHIIYSDLGTNSYSEFASKASSLIFSKLPAETARDLLSDMRTGLFTLDEAKGLFFDADWQTSFSGKKLTYGELEAQNEELIQQNKELLKQLEETNKASSKKGFSLFGSKKKSEPEEFA